MAAPRPQSSAGASDLWASARAERRFCATSTASSGDLCADRPLRPRVTSTVDEREPTRHAPRHRDGAANLLAGPPTSLRGRPPRRALARRAARSGSAGRGSGPRASSTRVASSARTGGPVQVARRRRTAAGWPRAARRSAAVRPSRPAGAPSGQARTAGWGAPAVLATSVSAGSAAALGSAGARCSVGAPAARLGRPSAGSPGTDAPDSAPSAGTPPRRRTTSSSGRAQVHDLVRRPSS